MTAHIGRVLVTERNVEGLAGLRHASSKTAPAPPVLDRCAQRRAQLRVQDGSGVLQFTVGSDQGRFPYLGPRR